MLGKVTMGVPILAVGDEQGPVDEGENMLPPASGGIVEAAWCPVIKLDAIRAKGGGSVSTQRRQGKVDDQPQAEENAEAKDCSFHAEIGET